MAITAQKGDVVGSLATTLVVILYDSIFKGRPQAKKKEERYPKIIMFIYQ